MSENTSRVGSRSNPADVLLNVYHRRILQLLLLRPEQTLHVRAIARETAISIGSLHRELKVLTDAGLLRRIELGNQVHYQADAGCSVFVELSALLRKLATPQAHIAASNRAMSVAETPAVYARHTAGRSDIQRTLHRLHVTQRSLDALCRRYHVSKLAFFGSVTRGDFKPGSDVDVLVEFSPRHMASLTDLVELRHALSKLFGGRSVDVATPATMTNPYRRQAIQRDLQIAYAAH